MVQAGVRVNTNTGLFSLGQFVAEFKECFQCLFPGTQENHSWYAHWRNDHRSSQKDMYKEGSAELYVPQSWKQPGALTGQIETPLLP